MKKPIKTYKAGPITAKIWENQHIKPDGSVSVFHTVSLDRVYKDKEDNWKNTSTFRIGDLPKAELVLKKAYEFLVLKKDTEPMASELHVTGNIPAIT